jgi:hypothetical protein
MKPLLVGALLGSVACGVLGAVAIAPTAHSTTKRAESTASRAPATTHPPTPTPPTTSTTSPLRSPSAQTAAGVQRAVRAVVPDATIGMEVFDRQTGAVLATSGADQQFASMSVVKLLIALDVLTNGTADDATRKHLQQLLSASDDGIANDLWGSNGGPAIVNRMSGRLGLSGTEPPEDPGEWGDTMTTAQDLVTAYRYITDRLDAPDRDLVLGALWNAPQIAADGFNQYFGIPDGLPNTTWAVKQGWGTSGSLAVMNTTGLAGANSRYVVVLLSSAPANSYLTLSRAVTAGIGALESLLGD